MSPEVPIDWQTPAAIAVVVITALIFLYQITKKMSRKNSGGCSGSCDCKISKPKPLRHL